MKFNRRFNRKIGLKYYKEKETYKYYFICQLEPCCVPNPYDRGVYQFLGTYRKLEGFWTDDYRMTTGLLTGYLCFSMVYKTNSQYVT